MAVRTIVVGLGGRGRHWAREVQQSPFVEFAGIVDPDAERMARASGDLGVPGDRQFDSIENAVRAAGADAAVIVTPNVLHEEHIRLCLDLGLHVLCEKPFVMHREAGAAIVAEAARKGLVAQAVQNYRWNSGTLTVRKLIQEKAVGEPAACIIDFHRLRPIHGMSYPLLYNQGIHHLDAVRWVFGCNASWAMAHSWNPAWHDCDGDTIIEATYGLENGVIVHYSGNYCSHGCITPYSGLWRIECSEGSIHFHGDTEIVVRVRRGHEALDGEAVPLETCDHGGNGELLRTFGRAIERGEPAPTRAADNLNSLEMIWAAVESSETGRRVELQTFADS